MNLKGKKVLLGVCGGIAAYKALELVSQLKKSGAEIKVIMTKSATEFVSPLSFQTMSQNLVSVNMFDEPKAWEVQHISLAKWPDIFVVVPATANIIGKVACGIADDMLSTTLMASTRPKLIAPAMNTAMYNNPIVQRNISALKDLGIEFIAPLSGRLACGDEGEGKLAEPKEIYDRICKALLYPNKDLEGKKVLVTAGATIEKIDPVRYITNRSTGKMGAAIAKAAEYRGAEVTLICGKCSAELPYNVNLISVSSADEMYDAVIREAESADIIVKSAAVADYKPENVAENKIKKGKISEIKLEANKDILAALGEKYSGKKTLVGFCMETENLVESAKGKLQRKGLDLIAANSIKDEGAGFGTNTNIVTLIDRAGNIEKTDKCDKFDIANIIIDRIINL